ncbi:MAG: YaaC family protein [Arcobacteraceae bacterium]
MSKEKFKQIDTKLKENKMSIQDVKEQLKPIKPRLSIKYKNREASIRKPKIFVDFSTKTVLTDSTWEYVKIYLKSENQTDALFYWEQAYNFYEATKSLTLISKPLTAYYCFLNATKALLEVKNVNYDLAHGVTGKKADGLITIRNEIVKFQPKGVVSALSYYLEESIPEEGIEFSLKDIFYNLSYIHRSFTLTYKDRAELFIPILRPRFVYDKSRNESWLELQLEPEHSNKTVLNKLKGYSIDKYYDNSEFYTLRRNKTFTWNAPRSKPTSESMKNLKSYYSQRRKELRYIYSPRELWYIKRKDLTNNIIGRSTISLTIGAMHRLSELSRYNPKILSKHLEKDASWLLTEFINKSIYQFIDQISSEITGNDFRVTGFRT